MPFTPLHTQPAVFMLFSTHRCPQVQRSPYLAAPSGSSRYPPETCAFPLSHVLSCVHTHRCTKDLHTGKSLQSPCVIHTLVCALYTHTDTDMDTGRMYTLKSHTHTRHSHVCMYDILCPVSTHHSHTHATGWNLQGAWAENMSREAGTDRKLQSPASPPGAAAQSTVPTWALKGSPLAQSFHHLRQ